MATPASAGDGCSNCGSNGANGSCTGTICYQDGAGEGEPCPAPRPCLKVSNHISDQDNGYHNMLQAMHGSKESIANVYIDVPETTTTPAHYRSTTPTPYTGVFGPYYYNGDPAGNPYTPTR